MKTYILAVLCLTGAVSHAGQATRLITPENYLETCKIDFLIKRAADKKVVEFYNRSRWAIIPAGMTAAEVEKKYGVSSLDDLKFIKIEPSAEADVNVADDQSQVYTASRVWYQNKAGTLVGVQVQRSTPLIARMFRASSSHIDYVNDLRKAGNYEKLDMLDSSQVVEVSGDQSDRETFCALTAVGGATDFK